MHAWIGSTPICPRRGDRPSSRHPISLVLTGSPDCAPWKIRRRARATPVPPLTRWTGRPARRLRSGPVTGRHLRRLGGVIPRTRIGRVRWPRAPARPWPWHYWWQAHLLDCLVDAQLRAPRPKRADAIAAVARTVRLRNLGRWTNDYYDDVAWFGLAVQRPGRWPAARPTGAGRRRPPAARRVDRGRRRRHLVAARRRLQERSGERTGRDPAGPRGPRRAGGVHRRLDARHAARSRHRPHPRRRAGGPDGSVRAVEGNVHLLPGRAPRSVRGARRGGRHRGASALGGPRRGAAGRGGDARRRLGRCHPRLRRRRRRRAVQRHPRSLPGRCRALRRPELAPVATRVVLASAAAAWRAGRNWRTVRCSPRTGDARPDFPIPAGRRRTCRCSSRVDGAGGRRRGQRAA